MAKILTEKECLEYYKVFNTPSHVIEHCRAVSLAATRIGLRLNEVGYNLDISLIKYSALIHDMARTTEHHEIVGADFLKKEGYTQEAFIVRGHMTHHFNSIEKLDELDVVCLADRVVKENQYVGLDERIDYLIHKNGENPQRTAHLNEARESIRKYITQLEDIMDESLDSICCPTLDSMLKQVEKPGRYIGNELNMVIKPANENQVRFAFAFPDLYEIGMSYMGLQILYNTLNNQNDIYCERVFAPAEDMETLMRKKAFPLFTLETKTSCNEMDVLGFTLQYEMSYTNILNMLELAEIPLYSKNRNNSHPLVIAGGPCAFNPEPLADFVDIFLIGDGEKLLISLFEIVKKYKNKKLSKLGLLREASKLTGVYIPSFYEPAYSEDGLILEYRKLWENAPDFVDKALIDDIDELDFPIKPLVPLIETVHDRSVVETFRGCTRGCRFCQAGMIYRPIRERSKQHIIDFAKAQIENSGNDELALLSLSTSDYSKFESLATELMDYCRDNEVSLSLPSLRLDNFSFKVLEEIQKYKKSGLTFAPEAGTQRLRDVINKGITEEDIYSSVKQAIELGWRKVKLYFMIGLPYETYEDLDGIANIAQNIMNIYKEIGKGGRFNVTVSVSNFVPKAHTPFQWVPQDSTESFTKKHNYLLEKLKIRGVTFNYHDDSVSTCEAIFARGDRRCGKLLYSAHKAGCKMDGWSEFYNRDVWEKLWNEWDVEYKSITERTRSYEEILPWDIIHSGVTKEFLIRENENAKNAKVTQDCRLGCVGCGINRRTVCKEDGVNA